MSDGEGAWPGPGQHAVAIVAEHCHIHAHTSSCRLVCKAWASALSPWQRDSQARIVLSIQDELALSKFSRACAVHGAPRTLIISLSEETLPGTAVVCGNSRDCHGSSSSISIANSSNAGKDSVTRRTSWAVTHPMALGTSKPCGQPSGLSSHSHTHHTSRSCGQQSLINHVISMLIRMMGDSSTASTLTTSSSNTHGHHAAAAAAASASCDHQDQQHTGICMGPMQLQITLSPCVLPLTLPALCHGLSQLSSLTLTSHTPSAPNNHASRRSQLSSAGLPEAAQTVDQQWQYPSAHVLHRTHDLGHKEQHQNPPPITSALLPQLHVEAFPMHVRQVHLSGVVIHWTEQLYNVLKCSTHITRLTLCMTFPSNVHQRLDAGHSRHDNMLCSNHEGQVCTGVQQSATSVQEPLDLTLSTSTANFQHLVLPGWSPAETALATAPSDDTNDLCGCPWCQVVSHNQCVVSLLTQACSQLTCLCLTLPPAAAAAAATGIAACPVTITRLFGVNQSSPSRRYHSRSITSDTPYQQQAVNDNCTPPATPRPTPAATAITYLTQLEIWQAAATQNVARPLLALHTTPQQQPALRHMTGNPSQVLHAPQLSSSPCTSPSPTSMAYQQWSPASVWSPATNTHACAPTWTSRAGTPGVTGASSTPQSAVQTARHTPSQAVQTGIGGTSQIYATAITMAFPAHSNDDDTAIAMGEVVWVTAPAPSISLTRCTHCTLRPADNLIMNLVPTPPAATDTRSSLQPHPNPKVLSPTLPVDMQAQPAIPDGNPNQQQATTANALSSLPSLTDVHITHMMGHMVRVIQALESQSHQGFLQGLTSLTLQELPVADPWGEDKCPQGSNKCHQDVVYKLPSSLPTSPGRPLMPLVALPFATDTTTPIANTSQNISLPSFPQPLVDHLSWGPLPRLLAASRLSGLQSLSITCAQPPLNRLKLASLGQLRRLRQLAVHIPAGSTADALSSHAHTFPNRSPVHSKLQPELSGQDMPSSSSSATAFGVTKRAMLSPPVVVFNLDWLPVSLEELTLSSSMQVQGTWNGTISFV